MGSATINLACWAAVVLAHVRCVKAEEGDAEFAFNLFSDLAPILALFGEKFATQFASESLDWLDHLIFAMVPLGIVTAMTAAIRVQGPSAVRAFIGLARENLATAEIELMSSTSHEVCELFNGRGIVRAMGRASIKQILVFPTQYEEDENPKREDKPTQFLSSLKRTQGSTGIWRPSCGIHSIATACGYHPISTLGAPITIDDQVIPGTEVMRGREYRGYSYSGMSSALANIHSQIRNIFHGSQGDGDVIDDKTGPGDEESGSYPSPRQSIIGTGGGGTMPDAGAEDSHSHRGSRGQERNRSAEKQALRRLGPPNLQLNHSQPFSSEEEEQHKRLVLWVAAIAIQLQLGLVAIAGLTTYHDGTRTAVGYEYKEYGFPCYAAGSFALCLGMVICSFIIGHSTVEWSWEPLESPKHEPPVAKPGYDVPVQSPEDPHLFWIQKAQSVNDQTFSPYAIFEGTRRRIITSSRRGVGKVADEEKETARESAVNWGTNNPFRQLLGRTKRSLSKNLWEATTVVGVLAAAGGFMTQFIGLRALPYPVSFAQLGGIVIMALLRASIRSGMGRPLCGFETLPRYELEFLATQFVFNKAFRKAPRPPAEHDALSSSIKKNQKYHWRVLTAGDRNGDRFPFFCTTTTGRDQLETEGDGPDAQGSGIGTEGSKPEVKVSNLEVSSQQLLRVRQRLGYVTTWQSTAFSASLALDRSIVYVLSEFFKEPWKVRTPEQKPDSTFQPDDTICMNITLPVTRTTDPISRPGEEDTVTIRCFWQRDRGWELDRESLEAVLSLWMAYVEERYPPGPRPSAVDIDGKGSQQAGWFGSDANIPIYWYRRILGDDFHKSGVLKRDLSWWVDGFNDQLLTSKTRDESTAKLVIGFNGPETQVRHAHKAETRAAELATESCMPLPLILAQHVFTIFMWSIAQYLPRNCLGQGLPEHDQEVEVSWGRKFVPQRFHVTWSEPTLSQRSLSKVTQQIERAGLGDTTEILLCIIPALSFMDLLPNEVMLRMLPQKGPDWGWVEVAACYNHLLQSNVGASAEEHFCYEIVVAAVDFLLAASEPYDDDIEPRSELRKALEELVKTLVRGFCHILVNLFPIYQLQHRFQEVKRALALFGGGSSAEKPVGMNPKSNDVFDKFLTLCGSVGWRWKDHYRDPWNPDYHDFLIPKLSFSDGHYKILPLLDGDGDAQKSDPSGPEAGNDKLGPDDYATIGHCANKHDIFGWTPLHYTSLCPNYQTIQKIYGGVAAAQAEFENEKRAVAAAVPTEDRIRKRVILKLRDKLGRSPVHVAVLSQRADVLGELLTFAEDRRAVAQSAGFDGLTTLHFAAKAESDDCFDTLRKELHGTPATKQDIWDREALHIAASLARKTICEKLLECRGGAEPEREDATGRTPLMYALKMKDKNDDDRKDISRQILGKVKEPSDLVYDGGGTVLHLAAEYGNLDGDNIRTLLDIVGQNTRRKDRGAKSAKKKKDEKTKRPDKQKDSDKQVSGLNINSKDADGRVPLHVAILARRSDNALFLLQQKDELDLDPNIKTREDVSAAAMACQMGLVDVLEELLKQGDISVDERDTEQKSLLHFAVRLDNEDIERPEKTSQYEKIVEMLLGKGANLKAADANGQTPLIAACISGFTPAVSAILAHASRSPNPEQLPRPKDFSDMVNWRDVEYDQSALEYACEKGYQAVIQQLLQYPEVRKIGSAKKWHGYTALHFAISFAVGTEDDGKKIIRLLCDAIPDLLEVVDEYGRTPLQLAEDRHRYGMRMEILGHANTRYEHKESFLRETSKNPEEKRVECIPGLIHSLKGDDFLKLSGERDHVAQLADPKSIVAWTEKALESCQGSQGSCQADIPCHFAVHFAVRGDEEVVKAINLLQKHWDGHKARSSFEKLTERDHGWSILDWARKLGIQDATLKKLEDKYEEALRELDDSSKKAREADAGARETRYAWDLPKKCQDIGCAKQDPYGLTRFSIKQSTAADLGSDLLCLRTKSCLAPGMERFSFEVRIIEWPVSGTLMIGFCGEFFPDEENRAYPGKFYNSWGFEDRGRLYVEGSWDYIPSQGDNSSSFEKGDIIVVSLEPATKRTCYSKKSKNSKGEFEFMSKGEDAAPLLSSKTRFGYGKIYPCIGMDASSWGEGLDIEVSLGSGKPGKGR